MYPFGLAPDAEGTGTTPEGLQRILHARYARPGIIDGCAVTLSTTGMIVAVGAGAVAVVRASGFMVEVPVAPVAVTANRSAHRRQAEISSISFTSSR